MMTFCKKCGTQMENGVDFCPNCGERAEGEQQAATRTSNDAGRPQMPPVASADGYDSKDIEENKIMAILAYFGPLVLVPIFAAPKSKFARFHANQGLVVFICEVGYAIIQAILMTILRMIFPWNWSYGYWGGRGAVFNICSTVLTIAWIAVGILAVIGLINAVQGKVKEVPFVGKFRLLK